MSLDRSTYINQPLPIQKELKLLFDTKASLTIFEIGACEGEDSIRYSRLFPNARIYAFEPLPDNVKRIELNIAQYADPKKVSVHQVALAQSKGTAEFHVSSGRPKNTPESDWDYGNKSSSLLPPDKHIELADFISFDKKITVQTQTLQSFCQENHIETIDFIHMDVQGAELMVLQGAAQYIRNIKALWLEVSNLPLYKDQPLAGDVLQFMENNNFALALDCAEGIQGDHLYISKSHFPNYAGIIKQMHKKPSMLDRLMIKLGLK